MADGLTDSPVEPKRGLHGPQESSQMLEKWDFSFMARM